jgi:hypothetical protein
VRLLAATKANVTDRQGMTPLQHVRSRGYREIGDLERADGRETAGTTAL